jgi:hypothetical protein
MTKKELQKLRRMMPKGYRQTLADEFKISAGYIDQILRGDKDRTDVIEYAIKIAKLHQEHLNGLTAQIKKL